MIDQSLIATLKKQLVQRRRGEDWQTFFSMNGCESSSLNLWGSLSEEFSSETNQVTETPLWDQLKWRHSHMAANPADRRLHNISSENLCFQSVLESAHHHSNLVYFLPPPPLPPPKVPADGFIIGRTTATGWTGQENKMRSLSKNGHLFQVASHDFSSTNLYLLSQ